MKKILLCLAVAAIATAPALSQENKATTPQEQKDPKKDRGDWDKKIKDELKLTADQIAKYDALSKEYNEKIDVIVQDASLDKNVQKEKKMALKKEKESKLMEFLTAEQQELYKAIIEKKKKEMEGAKKPGA